MGNGFGYRQGVDESALPYYRKHIENFNELEITDFIKLFGDAEFSLPEGMQKPDANPLDSPLNQSIEQLKAATIQDLSVFLVSILFITKYSLSTSLLKSTPAASPSLLPQEASSNRNFLKPSVA